MPAAHRECRVEKPGVVLLYSLRLPGAGSSSGAVSALGLWMQLVQTQLTSLPAGSVTLLGKADWRALWVSSPLPLTSRPDADRAMQVLKMPGARQQ